MKQSFSNTTQATPKASGLGTFGGVYTPSVLTILGVIMYLRFGWVVGHVGLIGTLLIVTLSTLITFLTALSICTIATDRVVRTGGAYYMISRSLGIETGGAVGIPLYFAQALSVALYTIGFAESVVSAFGQFDQVNVALITTVVIAVVALTSAEMAIRVQYLIMAVIALSLVSLALGQPVEPTQVDWWVSSRDYSFWEVFAIFFPAVTGIMAGVNLSGDLRDPTRAIPMGTLAAVGTGYVIYMILPLILATRASGATLISDPLVMKQLSLWSPAILLGVWGATLSSALGSLLGAPRVLQALARDGVLPDWLRFLGRGSGPADEPRLGTLVTMIVVTVAVALGELNLIAPVLTMFFLTTYLVLNLVAGIEGLLKSPSFRPTFQVPWILPLLGSLGCISVMVLINAMATGVAAVIVLGIYLWLQKRSMAVAWGDVRSGIWMALMRMGVFQISPDPDTKNWRPHVLVLTREPHRRWSLIQLADALTAHWGLLTVATILPNEVSDTEIQAQEQVIRNHFSQQGIQSLVRILRAAAPFEGAWRLVETYGLGPLVPNTVMLGDSSDSKTYEHYCQLIVKIHQAQRNVVILRENRSRGFGQQQRIDVWWRGLQANGGLMLLLAYLISQNLGWTRAQVYLKLVAPDDDRAQVASQQLEKLLKQLRLKFIPQVLLAEGRSFDTILRDSSQTADLVFLGLAKPVVHFPSYYDQLHQRTTGLPTTLFVLAAPHYNFREVLMKSEESNGSSA